MKGGNLGAASDLLRWISPVYKLGTYSDFDVTVDTRKLPPTLTIEKPFLVKMGSVVLAHDFESLIVNNNIIAIIDPKAPEIQKIQRILIDACRAPVDCFKKSLQHQFAYLDPRITMLKSLIQLSTENHKEIMLIRELRHIIMKTTENNAAFSQSISDNNDDDPQCQAKTAQWLREMLSDSQDENSQLLLAIQDDSEFLTTIRKQHRLQWLRSSIMYTSGAQSCLKG